MGREPGRGMVFCVVMGSFLTAERLTAQTSTGLDGTPEEGRDAPVVDGRHSYEVGVADEEIRIDGVLDEGPWLGSVRISLPYETAPGDNTAAEAETTCHVIYDADNLYFGCAAYDPDPSSIRAYVTDRDRLMGHDVLSLVIDPFNDSRRAFEFEVNALGVQGDALLTNGDMGSDRSWDAIWDAAGRLTSDGYVVEASVPFRSLRFPSSRSPQTWGFYLKRMRPRSERVETRSMTLDRNDSCELCQANLLHGVQGGTPGLNVELVPTATASRTDQRPGDAPSLQSGTLDWDPGVSGRWSITTDLTLNGTVNPDFSQIEADAPQLEINNQFALFFPERRPFFLEGADLFRTPLQAVFTRTIADPVAGAKLTGKSGPNAMGLMVARDQITNLLFPGAQGSSSTSLDEGVTSTIARYRRDVGSSSTVGGVYTGRFGSNYQNHVYGVDANIRPISSLSIETQLLRSRTDYPTEVASSFNQSDEAFSGTAARMSATWRTREWAAQINGRTLERDFRADAGFINQVNARGGWGWVERTIWADDSKWFTRILLQPGGWYTGEQDGGLVDRGLWFWFNYQGPLQSTIWLNPDWTQQVFAGRTYEFQRLWGGASFQPLGAFRLGFNGNVGGAIDFANAREADEIRVSPNMEVRFGRNVDLNLSYTIQRLSTGGQPIFTANVSQLRAVYNFSPRAFFRGTWQFRRTTRNPELYAFEVDRSNNRLFSQLLFSYKLNPLTVFFLGYADNRSGLEDFNRQTVPFETGDRTFFLKVGYAWRP